MGGTEREREREKLGKVQFLNIAKNNNWYLNDYEYLSGPEIYLITETLIMIDKQFWGNSVDHYLLRRLSPES
jgi:hypothetical protein